MNEELCKKQIIVGANPLQKGLFEFAHENARFEAVHLQREVKQFKIRLPLALAELPQQNSFELIKQLIRVIARINCVQNVPKDWFWQVGKGICVFEFLQCDTCRSKLRLDEAEQDRWFLLIAWTQFGCLHGMLTNLYRHAG